MNVDLITQFAVFDTSADDVAPEPELLFHPFVELVLAVGIIEEHLLEEMKVTGIGQLSGHLLPLDVAQSHDLGHGALHTLDVFVDEIAQRPVRRCKFVFRILEMEEIAVGHGDEEVEFGGIIVEDPGFGSPTLWAIICRLTPS